MKVLGVFLFLCALGAAQQAPAPTIPNLPDDTVIAVFDDGVKFTMGDYKKLYAAMPATNQQNMLRDRKGFLEQYALMRKLAHMAEAEKLDQASPAKEILEFNRLLYLSQAKMNKEVMNQDVPIPEIAQYYDAHQNQYKQVKVKAIYIMFSKAQASQLHNGKPMLTEDEAKAKAQKLVAEIRAGADFVKLVHENSDDPKSRDQDGDFATLQASDTIPEAIKSAVFALKQGEVTDPVEQPNGFYLLQAEEVKAKTLAEVRSDIIETLRQEHFKKWIDQLHDNVKVQFPDPQFLGTAAAAPAAK